MHTRTDGWFLFVFCTLGVVLNSSWAQECCSVPHHTSSVTDAVTEPNIVLFPDVWLFRLQCFDRLSGTSAPRSSLALPVAPLVVVADADGGASWWETLH